MDERYFNRGEIVFIRDYPLGKPLNVYGKVVGFVNNDSYNVRLLSGLHEGNIVAYHTWKLMSEKEAKWHFKAEQ